MADKLTIYNQALTEFLGERPLVSLSEDCKARRVLDAVWNGAGEYVLAEAIWQHATRAVEIEPDPDVEPLFGFQYAYTLPDDYVRISEMTINPRFNDPLNNYRIEAQKKLFCDYDKIYLAYVSNGDEYGWDVASWPELYVSAVAARLAYQAALSLQQNKDTRTECYQLYQRYLSAAKARLSVDKPTRRMPVGALVKSRMGLTWRDNGRG